MQKRTSDPLSRAGGSVSKKAGRIPESSYFIRAFSSRIAPVCTNVRSMGNTLRTEWGIFLLHKNTFAKKWRSFLQIWGRKLISFTLHFKSGML
jgi:hypothetical protein